MKNALLRWLSTLLVLALLLPLCPAALTEGIKNNDETVAKPIEPSIEEQMVDLTLISHGNKDETVIDNAMESSFTDDIDIVDNAEDVAIDEVTFPDNIFRTYVLENCDTDGNAGLSGAEINAVTSIDCSSRKITSLAGIEMFSALTYLNCKSNKLTALDLSHNRALTDLLCDFNRITSLDVSQNTALQSLECDSNPLGKLDVRHNDALKKLSCTCTEMQGALDVSHNIALEWLACDTNKITSLDLSHNPALKVLDCGYGNPLGVLDLSHNTALEWLRCNGCSLVELDVRYNTALTSIDCSNNQLTALDVSQNAELAGLYCYNNQLEALDVSHNTALEYLVCSNNQLTELDVTYNTALKTGINCANNHLKSLDLSHNTKMEYLVCSGNQLTTLDISHNTALNRLNCSDNQLTALDVSHNTVLNNLYCSNNHLAMLNISQCPNLVKCYQEGICSTSGGIRNYTLKRYYADLSVDESVNIIDGVSISSPETESVSIQASKVNPIGIKDTVQLTVKASADVSLKKLSWSSSNTKVATVNAKGVVTGKSAGKATITVTTGEKKKASIEIVVQDINAPTAVHIEPSGPKTIGLKETVQFTAKLTAVGTPKTKLKWTTSNKKVATVDAKGKVTGKAGGSATITVTTANGPSASVEMTVRDINTPTAISLEPSGPKTIGLKENLQLTAVLTAEGTPKTNLKWTTSNKKVATVDTKGKVTGKAGGSATITVTTANGLSASVEVTVRNINTPTAVSLEPSGPKTIGLKETLQLTAVLTAEGTPKTKLKWTSSNAKVATVDSKGKVTGKAGGTATITVKTDNGLNASITIDVKDTSIPTSISITPSSVEPIHIKDTIELRAHMVAEGTPKSKLTWSSSNSGVATVSTTGKVAAKGLGIATITVTTHNGLSASVDINVVPVDLPIEIVNTDLDNAFLVDNETVNLPIRYQSMVLAEAAYSMKKSSSEMEEKLRELGFGDFYTHLYYEDGKTGNSHDLAYIFGYKDINDFNGCVTRLFVVVCRGTWLNAEWASNFTIGTGDIHKGFDATAKKVSDAFKKYFKAHSETSYVSDYKVWVTGHSRGAAVANLLAGYYFPQKLGINNQRIYAYTFACPNVSKGKLAERNYIFNYNLGGDLVARVPFTEWNYGKYGRNYILENEGKVAGYDVIDYYTMNRLTNNLGKWANKDILYFYEHVKKEILGDEFVSVSLIPSIILGVMRDRFCDNLDYGPLLATIDEIVSIRDISITRKYIFNTHQPETYLAWMESVKDKFLAYQGSVW